MVRALALTALLAGAMAWLYFTELSGLKMTNRDHLALWPFVTLGVWAAGIEVVPLRNRRFSLELALDGIPVLVGIVFLPPWAALTAISCGKLAVSIQRRLAPVKALANWLAYAASVSVGILAYDKGLGGSSPVSARGWFMSAAAVAIISIVDLVVILIVMAAADRRWRHPPLSSIPLQLGLDVAVCTAAGLVAVSLVWVSTWGIVLFIGIAVAADLAFRATVVSGQRYANLERLYEFTRRLGSLVEARDVITTVLEEARVLLSADRAELVAPLEPPLERLALCCSLKGDHSAQFEEGAPLSPLEQLIRERGSLLLPRNTKDKLVADAMAAEGVNEGLVAPLQRDDPTAGYLLVADRAFKHEGFKRSDLRFFEALAANAGVALRSSELLEKLRHEAAVRQHQAHHDGLTGLPNRTLFAERLEQALDRAVVGGKVAVMLIDLDGFKEVNDTLGHGTGDAILREIARRLSPLESEGDLVARLGGDEFAVLVTEAPPDDALAAKAERVVTSICEPLAADGLLLDVRASLGVAVFPAHAGHATGLLRCADVAMYGAKGAGGGVRVYDVAEDRSTPRRLRLATELRRAMEAKALDLWYQPVVQLGTGEVISCEALLRWSHDQFGPIPPNEFIPVAESAGLIDPLTWWVLEVALRQAKAWRRLVPGLTMAVNLSARSLMSMDIAERLGCVIQNAGLEPAALTLELTESSTIADPVGSERVLRSLADLGVNLSIDDFGTGYSSLSRLKRLPFQELKIDRSFVKEMVHDKGDEAIVRSTIELARNLGRMVTAEGVEDQQTLRRLAALGCDAAQGFFLARPLPAPQCEAWLLAAPSTWPRALLLPRGPGGIS
jgi:diguanylate cyclase (GGDEF)-like protein